jgi:NADPH:quinone reductase-like Zn-dependent oxidoreductase
MRALQLTAFGSEHLQLVELPEPPPPGPGEALVQLRAASLNYRDLLMIDGHYDPRVALPLVPLSDGVAEVVAVGPGVQRVQVGDRVAPLFAQGWLAGEPARDRVRHTLGGPLPGTLRERALFPVESLVKLPDYLTDVEAATLPCAALTAWTALMRHGPVLPGETVVVQGTGGVALFALQFGRLAGARVIVTSSSPAKLERAASLGMWQGIDYRATPAWGKRVLELTNGRGADHIVELGGAGTLQESLRAARIGGHVAVIGVLAGAQAPLLVTPILMNQLRVQGVLVGHRDDFEAMLRALAQHELRPVVDSVWPWTAAREAVAHQRSGRHFGKIALTWADG